MLAFIKFHMFRLLNMNKVETCSILKGKYCSYNIVCMIKHNCADCFMFTTEFTEHNRMSSLKTAGYITFIIAAICCSGNVVQAYKSA